MGLNDLNANLQFPEHDRKIPEHDREIPENDPVFTERTRFLITSITLMKNSLPGLQITDREISVVVLKVPDARSRKSFHL